MSASHMRHVRRLAASARDDVPRAITGLAGAVLTLALLGASAGGAESAIKVDWNKGRLSVSAENAELSQVLREVAHQTGISSATTMGVSNAAQNGTLAVRFMK